MSRSVFCCCHKAKRLTVGVAPRLTAPVNSLISAAVETSKEPTEWRWRPGGSHALPTDITSDPDLHAHMHTLNHMLMQKLQDQRDHWFCLLGRRQDVSARPHMFNPWRHSGKCSRLSHASPNSPSVLSDLLAFSTQCWCFTLLPRYRTFMFRSLWDFRSKTRPLHWTLRLVGGLNECVTKTLKKEGWLKNTPILENRF